MVKCKYKEKCLDYPELCESCKFNEEIHKGHYYQPTIHYHFFDPIKNSKIKIF